MRLLRSLHSLAKTRGKSDCFVVTLLLQVSSTRRIAIANRFHSSPRQGRPSAADQSFLRNGQNLFARNKRLLLKAVSRRWINGHMERNPPCLCAESQNNRIRVMGVAICRIRLNDNRRSQAGLFGNPAPGCNPHTYAYPHAALLYPSFSTVSHWASRANSTFASAVSSPTSVKASNKAAASASRNFLAMASWTKAVTLCPAEP